MSEEAEAAQSGAKPKRQPWVDYLIEKLTVYNLEADKFLPYRWYFHVILEGVRNGVITDRELLKEQMHAFTKHVPSLSVNPPKTKHHIECIQDFILRTLDGEKT